MLPSQSPPPGARPHQSALLVVWLVIESLQECPSCAQARSPSALLGILNQDWGEESEAPREQNLRRHTLACLRKCSINPGSERRLKSLQALGSSLTSCLSRPCSQNTGDYLFKKYIALTQRILATLTGRMSLGREHEFSVSRCLWGLGTQAQGKQGNGPWPSYFLPWEKVCPATLSRPPPPFLQCLDSRQIGSCWEPQGGCWHILG